jgi:selenocysteine lyase/cysteine desulfurase
MEHNAVFRPIYKLARDGIITYDVFDTFPTNPNRTTEMIVASILEKIRPTTRMLICAHASNICSATLPLKEIGALCRKKGILFVVDAAQSAGHLPIDMKGMQISALCAPGHKGLWGPQGCGVLILGDGVVADTLMEGGSGYNSLEGNMPEDAPERYEAGTLPTPAIAGLLEGVREIQKIGLEEIHAHESMLTKMLCERLGEWPQITLYAPHHKGSVLLFSIANLSADRVGAFLNERGFCVRTGFHCAALAHATLGTPPSGAIRVSPSFFNTAPQINAFCDAVKDLL